MKVIIFMLPRYFVEDERKEFSLGKNMHFINKINFPCVNNERLQACLRRDTLELYLHEAEGQKIQRNVYLIFGSNTKMLTKISTM